MTTLASLIMIAALRARDIWLFVVWSVSHSRSPQDSLSASLGRFTRFAFATWRYFPRRTTRQNRVARGELNGSEPLRQARPSYRPHNGTLVRSSPPHGSPAGRVTSSERISQAGNFPSIFWNYIQRWPLTRLSQAAPRAGHRGPRRWPEVVARKGRHVRDTRPRSPRSSAGARPTPARRAKRLVLSGRRLAPVLWPTIRRGRRRRRSPIPSQFPFLPTR